MSVSSDTRQALRLLERIQLHLKESNAAQINPSIGEDLNTLISVLDSPVFNSILNIQDSVQELKKQLHKHPSILPVDFDISPTTGELILNVPSDPMPLQNSDSYEPSSDPEQNYEFDNQLSIARIAIKQDGLDNESIELSVPTAAPPDYALSTITTDSYAEEFQKTIDQGAQGREIHTLQLFKPEGSSLGFSVVGLRSEQKGELGIFIQEIQQNGIAGRDGHLQEGDQILAIDGQPLDSNISHQQAISILQQARGLVELIVARGGIPITNAAAAADTPAPVSLERSPSAVSAGSKASDMVLNTEWAQVESIDLINDGAGLGFGIIGGRSTGVVVKTILPGGVADRDGRLLSGDHILQIGEVNLRGMGSEQVAMVLRQSGSHVRLIVARPVDPTSSDYCALQSSAPIVPTRILADPEEVEKHLAMFQQTQNGFPEPIPYKGPADVDANFIYQRELNGTEEFYNGSFLSSSAASQFERVLVQEAGGDLPEMEAFEVELVKDQQGLGITVAGYICEKEGISGIFVKSIAKGSAADLCGMIRVNDQIIEVDGRSLHGYTNHQAVEVLRNAGKIVKLRLARYLRGVKYEQLQKAIASGELSYSVPSAIQAKVHDAKPLLITEASNRDVDVPDSCLHIDDCYSEPLDPRCEAALQAKWSKIMGPDYEIVVSQLSKFREGGGLGISLEGTVDVEDGKEVRPHHYIRSILADGPVGVNGRLHGGDELLEVNGVKLLGMNHHGVVATLKELPMYVRMVCSRRLLPTERDVAPSLSEVDYSHPYHLTDYDLSTMPEFPDRGNLSGPFGGSLTSLTPVSERLVKAKSDGSLAIGTSASSSPPMEVTLSKLKSRSLEPLTGLAMWSSEPQIIELIKGDRGLGFSILDYQDPMNPNETVIVIRSLVPGGVAQQDGRLIPGDRLLFVNDINLENASLDAAVQALKGASKGVVRIGVAKPLPLPESSQSGQNVIEGGSGILELTRRPSFEFPVSRVPGYSLESEQPSSLPLKISSKIVLLPSSSSPQSDRKVPSPPCRESVLPSTGEAAKRSVSLFPSALERTARIKKGGDSLGLTVEIFDSIGGAVVSSVASNSAAEKDGRIEPGDFLLSVNGHSLVNVTEEEAAEIVFAAEKINTDVMVKYIPAADAAVHHQSALMSLDRQPESPVQTLRSSPMERLGGPKLERKEAMDIPDMAPPETPPPPPPPLPPAPSIPSLPEKSNEGKMSKLQTMNSVFDSSSILVLKREDESVSTTDRPANVSTFKPFKAVVRTPPVFEERKSLLSANIIKPVVPLKPLRPSLLTQLDIPGKEKSKVSSLEGLIGDMSPSSLSRQWGPDRSVELNRDPSKGLGISIISGKLDAPQAGIFVKNVLPDSPAGWNGTLKRGDRILEVGGIDLRNATHSKAVEVIKNAQNPVKFVVQSLVPVPKKTEGEVFSPETKLSKISRSELPRDAPEASQPMWPSALLDSSSFEKVPAPPLTVGSSPERGRVEVVEKEPPVPPPRTVSRMQKPPSDALEDAEAEEESGDQVPSSTLPQGKVLTKKGVQIDFGSAGNVRLSPGERSEDPEEADEFGYTAKKIQKKYGDMKGELIVVDIVKGSNKIGLSLAGNKDRTKMSVFVCGMHPSGNAAKDGRIKIGDELLEVNGLVMYGRCHLNASAMIKGVSGTAYKILLLRREGAVDEMAVKPLSQFPSELDEETPEDKYCHYRGMRTVTVRKGAHGLGIMIIEGKHAEVGQGIFISDIQENSAAEQAGLSVGDMILAANETDLVGADYDTAASILKQAEGIITLIVANPNKPSPGFMYDEESKSDELISKPQEKNSTKKTVDKKKDKSNPPLPPPKPAHLAGKSPVSNTSLITTTSSVLSSPLISCSAPNNLSPSQISSVMPVSTVINVGDNVSSFQEETEPLPDPKKCEIKPGRETTIEITKEKIGLGLSIVGGSDTPLGVIIIHEIYPDGAAALDGRLRPGDQILEVNGEDLREATHDRAITALRQTPAVVQMLVYREEGHNHEEDALELIEVELHKKPGRGLGLSIVGRKNGPGVFISEVVKGGVAEADGRLIQGDQIIEVNSQDLRNATQEHAAAVLKTTMGRINMKIGRLKAGSRRSTSCLSNAPKLEENMDSPDEYKTVVLERGPEGLGFSIVGGFGSPHGDLPIYVKKVFEKGAAAVEGRLQRGDQIVAVNEQSLEGLTHEEAVAVLKKVTGTITLVVLS